MAPEDKHNFFLDWLNYYDFKEYGCFGILLWLILLPFIILVKVISLLFTIFL